MELTHVELYKFARRLALALADEVAFNGEENAAEQTMLVLAEARERLGLAEEFDRLDSLALELGNWKR